MGDWQPESPEQYLWKCCTPLKIVWVILHVPMMGRTGKTRMMMYKVHSWASWGKMMNPAEWRVQSPKWYSIAWRGFGKSRWSLTTWCNLDGETQPTTLMRVIPHTRQMNWRSRLSLDCKYMIVQPHLDRQHLVNKDSWWCLRKITNGASEFWPTKLSYEVWFMETPVTQMHCVSPTRHSSQLVTYSKDKAWWTRKLLWLNMTSCANDNIEIGHRCRNDDGSSVTGGVNRQIAIFDDASLGHAIPVLILQLVTIYLILVTTVWGKIGCLCLCKGCMANGKVLDCQSHWLTTNELDIVLDVTVKSESYIYISDKIHHQYWIQINQMTHRWSSQRAMPIQINDNHYAAFIQTSNCITLCTDLVHEVEILKMADYQSRKSERISWMRNTEQVGLSISECRVWIYMQLIAGQKHWNVIGLCLWSLRYYT